jgi:hypothetical protein
MALVRRTFLAAVFLALVAGGCGTGTGETAPPPSGADYVLAPEQAHYGASLAQWSARWWQWALEHPVTDHPLFDTTGEDVAEWQIDPVWFIGGIIGTLTDPLHGFAERHVTIPSGVALFFPIINVEIDNGQCLPPGWGIKPISELRQFAYDTVNAVADVYCRIDGETIIDSPDLGAAVRYRVISPEFTASLPADNIGATLCGEPAVPTYIDPIVSDGIWMMLGPMPPGDHTIEFGGTFPTAGPFRVEIIYHVTVLP